jgi:hypothetical protein
LPPDGVQFISVLILCRFFFLTRQLMSLFIDRRLLFFALLARHPNQFQEKEEKK